MGAHNKREPDLCFAFLYEQEAGWTSFPSSTDLTVGLSSPSQKRR